MVMCFVSSCQPHLVPQEGRGGMPVIVETAYHSIDKVTVSPARCQRYGDILTTSRLYIPLIPSKFTTPHKVIAQGYDGLLPACKVVSVQILLRAEVSQLFSRMQETQIICAARAVLTFAANAADHSFLALQIHHSTSEKAIVLFFTDSCIDAALSFHTTGQCSRFQIYFAFRRAANDAC